MILVTGGTGLLGAWLLLRLTQDGHKVRAIRRKNASIEVVEKIFKDQDEKAVKLLSKIEWVEGDMLDIHSLEDAMVGITHVYHCAATVSFHPSDLDTLMKVNVEGTANIVNIALEKNITKLCYVSSIAAVGKEEKADFYTENADWQPGKHNSPYAVSKFNAEREVWRAMAEGLNAVIVNPSVILGVGKPGQGSTQLFEEINKGLKFYTPGITGFVDVRDVVYVMIRLMKSDISEERFIVNSENISYQTLFTLMADALKVKTPQIEAKSWMREIYWRLVWVKEILSGSKGAVTKQTARAAGNKQYYSSEKLLKALDTFEYHSIEEAVVFHSRFLK
jgi:nucleoside-diphosphate-sugar epimerase